MTRRIYILPAEVVEKVDHARVPTLVRYGMTDTLKAIGAFCLKHKRPWVTPSEARALIGRTDATAAKYLNNLLELGLLRWGSDGRGRGRYAMAWEHREQ